MSPTSYQAAPPRGRGGYLSREDVIVNHDERTKFVRNFGRLGRRPVARRQAGGRVRDGRAAAGSRATRYAVCSTSATAGSRKNALTRRKSSAGKNGFGMN